MKQAKYQRGFALLTAMAAGVLALTITSVVMLRLTRTSSQITQQESRDSALSLTESVMNYVLDSIADFDSQASVGTSNQFGVYYSARDFAAQLQSNTTTLVNTSSSIQANHQLKFSNVSGTANAWSAGSHPLYNSLQNSASHSTNLWDKFKQSDTAGQTINMNVLTNLDLGGGNVDSDFSLDKLHDAAFVRYHVQKGRLEADVNISIVPLATDIDGTSDATLHAEATFYPHNDVYKIQIESRVPNWNNAKSSKKIEMIVNRPVRLSQPPNFELNHAILAGGDIDMQNGNTSAGSTAGVIDTTVSGDIHSNEDVSLGANAHIQGKVTSSQTVDSNGTDIPSTDFNPDGTDPRQTETDITDRIDDPEHSKSDVDEIPMPDFDDDTSAVDGTLCSDAADITGWAHYSDCYLTLLNLKKSDTPIAFSGTIHILGNWTSKGTTRCVGSAPCRIIIDGVADVGGNATSDYSEQDTLMLVKSTSVTTAGTTCMDLGGNPDAHGSNGLLVVVANPKCNTKYHGNYEFFGGLITAGTFENKGNASSNGVQRDTDMSSLKDFLDTSPADKSQLYPDTIAWKDRL